MASLIKLKGTKRKVYYDNESFFGLGRTIQAPDSDFELKQHVT
jgi:hypothetical protein